MKVQPYRFLQVGRTLGGGVAPGRGVGAWPSPHPAQRAIFSKSRAQARPGLGAHATSARPGQRVSNLSLVICPAWLVRFLECFRCFFVLCLLLLEVLRQQRAR